MMNYKTGERIQIGDTVEISKKWCKENGFENATATVVDRYGFITVQLSSNGDKIDFDTRSLKFVSRR